MQPKVIGRFFQQAEWDNVNCFLCPHLCSIAPSRTGTCGVRTNRNGTLYVDNYGKVTTASVLSGEQIPLFHFKPENKWLSLSGKGCTMRCPFCSTYKFSQTGGVRMYTMTAADIIQYAQIEGCQGISFGVNDPAPMHEWVYDVFVEAKNAGLNTHLATSGMYSPEAVREILTVTDSITIGLKGFQEYFYSSVLGGDLNTIKENIDVVLTLGQELELTWLVIPGMTDTEEVVRPLKSFLEPFPNKPPVLLLPYSPSFSWTEPRKAALSDLDKVANLFKDYRGQVYTIDPNGSRLGTRCPKCGKTLIRRGVTGLIVSVNRDTENGSCPNCNSELPFIL